MMTVKKLTRLMALFLSLMMVTTCLPLSAFAADDTGGGTSPTEYAIPGYTQVTADPADLDPNAEYLIVVWVDGDAYAFYPHGTGMTIDSGEAIGSSLNSDMLAKLNTEGDTASAAMFADGSAVDMDKLHLSIGTTSTPGKITISNDEYKLLIASQLATTAANTGNTLTIAKNTDGTYKISYSSNNDTLRYLGLFLFTGWASDIYGSNFFAGIASYFTLPSPQGTYYNNLYLYTKGVEAEDGGEDDVEEETVPVIPGYTQVTAADLTSGEKYLIVSKDSSGNLYALYASAAGQSVSPGTLTGTPEACLARLTVSGETVSATTGGSSATAAAMDQLLFTATGANGTYSFQSGGYYLALGNTMFATTAANLQVAAPTASSVPSDGRVLIRTGTGNSNRILDLNVNGDDTSMYPNHITDFWGPRPEDPTTFPIYLYTPVGGSTSDPEPVTPPAPGANQQWAYVAYNTAPGGDKWGLSTNAYTVKFFKVEGTSATTGTLADTLEDGGVYLILAPTVGNGSARLMHDSTTATNQCTATNLSDSTVSVGGCGTSHMFQFSKNADGTWTIQGVASGNWLNVGTGALDTYNQLPLGAESAATKFVIEAVDGGFTIAAIVEIPQVEPDVPAVKFPTAGTGKTVIYQQVTKQSQILSNGELYAFVDATPYSGQPRILYHASGTGRTDQLEVTAGETLTLNISGSFTKERQLWSLVAVNGGYLLRSWDDGLYLTSTATSGQLTVNSTGSVFTVEAQDDGTFYVKSGDKYLDFFTTGGNGWELRDTAGSLKLYTPAVVEISGDPAQTVFKGTGASEPMPLAETGSSCFRIPSLITLSNGWIVASCDIRWRTSADSPQNLDTIVSVSKDGGITWDWEVVNYWADMANTTTAQTSASFIDPSVVQDSNGTIHMIVDACPSYVGLMGGNKLGEACTGFDSQGRMLVAKGTADEDAPGTVSSYTYYVDLNTDEEYHPICANDGTPTGYYVDAFLNIYQGEDHTPVMCLQQGSTDIVQSNLFYRQSEWKAFPTFFIMHRTATVTEDGLEWSAPQFLNVKNANERFLGVCPGRGTLTEDGRIIFPLYDNATGRELASVIYSDDNGATWTRGERSSNLNGTGKSSESQVVVLPDGTLRMYSRNTINYLGYADSTDGGKTWGQYTIDNSLYSQNPGNGCMVSFINVAGTLTGPDGQTYENLIAASYPVTQRTVGTVRIGTIDAETNEVTWLNEDTVLRYSSGLFAYSCLSQLPAGSDAVLGLLYESATGTNVVSYDSITIDRLMGESGWTLSVASSEEPHEHAWGEGVVTKEPTCTEAGEMTFTCECGESKTEPIEAKGHTVVIDEAVEPTYSSVGLTEGSHCSECGEVIIPQEEIPALTRPSTGGGGGGSFTPVAPSTPDEPNTPEDPDTPDEPIEDIEDPDVPLTDLPFIDVGKDAWYAPSVAYVYAMGFMNGNGDMTFTPTKSLTRGMMAQVLHNIAKNPTAPVASAFTDLNGKYYTEAVDWGASKGILNGYGNGIYGGERNVTRQEMVTMLYRYDQILNEGSKADLSVLDSFTDAGLVAEWAKEAMAWAVENGLVEGRGQNNIDPLANITRAEVAAILERYAKAFLVLA